MSSRGILFGWGGFESGSALTLHRPVSFREELTLKFLNWLFAHTPRQADPLPTIETFQPFNLGALARSDQVERADAQERSSTDDPVRMSETLIRLPDVHCMIEYRDVEGVETRRRVTLRALDFAGAPLLRAFCHERRAARTFRLDRIMCFITSDGEVIPPDRYCDSVLGLEITGPAFFKADDIAPARRLMAAIATPMTILVAVARADGDYATTEVDRIEAALERELIAIADDKRRKIDLQLVLDGHLARIIRDCRPTQETLRSSAKELIDWSAVRVDRLSRAIGEVMRADGHIHASEIDAVSSIAELSRQGRQSRLAFLLNDLRDEVEWTQR